MVSPNGQSYLSGDMALCRNNHIVDGEIDIQKRPVAPQVNGIPGKPNGMIRRQSEMGLRSCLMVRSLSPKVLSEIKGGADTRLRSVKAISSIQPE
jgi:hypothetical protein